MAEVNMGLEAAERLVERFGFDRTGMKNGWMRKMVGDHAVLAMLEPWKEKSPHGGTRTSVTFAVARTDMNQLWHDLISSGVSPIWPTVAERGSLGFFGQRTNGWISALHTTEEMFAWIDEWVPHMLEERITSLEFVEEQLTFQHARIVRLKRPSDWTHVPRFMLRLVQGGWTTADEEEFIAPRVARIEAASGLKLEPQLREDLERLRAWMAEHPDGILDH